LQQTIAGAESGACFSLADLFRLTRSHPVRAIDVACILIHFESDYSTGLGSYFAIPRQGTTIGQSGLPQDHVVAII